MSVLLALFASPIRYYNPLCVSIRLRAPAETFEAPAETFEAPAETFEAPAETF